ncbi:MAG: hypothetical protein M1825_002388 [Sarcosagium campestre]|nr:MAG: hypothetical protein M1825_002388 [Sarcosagium campestre]
MQKETNLPESFERKKDRIITQLHAPADKYEDLSPKGSVDTAIRPLIDNLNSQPGLVTTSSCAGRVSIYLEGRKTAVQENNDIVPAGVGGKGGGGRWLFVSHETIELPPTPPASSHHFTRLFGLDGGSSDEAIVPNDDIILHILTASPSHAQSVLTAALSSGFRESGALNITPSGRENIVTPMVAIRSTGLALDCIVGCLSDEKGDSSPRSLVGENYLAVLVRIANERFVENAKRISRFQSHLALQSGKHGSSTIEGLSETSRTGKSRRASSGWEDGEVRMRRLKEEGLRKRKDAQQRDGGGGSQIDRALGEDAVIDGLFS